MIYSYDIALTLRGPILTRATGVGEFGVDAPVARLADGSPYIAGSHVLGKARHALDVLAGAAGVDFGFPDILLEWFGGPGDEWEGQFQRRMVYFSDLRATSTGTPGASRTRIAIDSVTGTAVAGALQVLEAPFGPGEEVIFEGQLRIVGAKEDCDKVASAIQRALSWTTQMGGLRSVGFGECAKVKIRASQNHRNNPTPPTSDALGLLLSFRDPFCIAEGRKSGNNFVSSDVVPGGVVKGALAFLMTQGRGGNVGDIGLLGRNFSKLKVSHLFPVRGKLKETDETVLRRIFDSRPGRIPLSLVFDGVRLHDVALVEGPGLFGGRAPSFVPDWKGTAWTLAEHEVGWSAPDRELRVRTAINPATLAAAPEQLFSYEMTRTDDHVWVGEIGLEDVPENDRWTVRQELAEHLADGLLPIGRSGAFAHAHLFKRPEQTRAKPQPLDREFYCLTLQTPALLWSEEGGYKESLEEITDSLFSLERQFTCERLSGAHFMANRYFRGRTYQPWYLTEPGSVFVLKLRPGKDPDKARTKIAKLEECGLPLSSQVKRRYDLPDEEEAALWRYCPYIRHNGYGEIAVNVELHKRLRPYSPNLVTRGNAQ